MNFTEYLGSKKKENERVLGLVLKLAGENEIIYNLVPVNFLIEDMEKLKNGFFTNDYFSLCDKEEIQTNGFLKDSNDLAKFTDKILDIFDDHPSQYYTGKNHRRFRNFKRVNRSEHGRSAISLKLFWNLRVKTVKYRMKMHVFSSASILFSRKTLERRIWNSFNHIKENKFCDSM